ncbi:MAG: hypothetical protein CVV60_05955 [Tenericutes bacterium HGW-Tenericutes-5]|jgi:hypothetical protein|nr:MAG: hypothetical protein CVV60_05955 [Tenericutes bacterium HGW-Tenericutes-5]
MTIKDFFTTTGMDDHPTKYLFGPYHLLYFLLFIISFILLFKIIKSLKRKNQDRFITIALIAILILKYATEVLFIYEYYTLDQQLSSYTHPFFNINTFFSFQLCGVMNILLPIVYWFDIKKLKPFVYLTSILGGLAVVFYPVTVLYGDPLQINLPMFRSVIVHFFLVLIPLILINRGDINIKKKDAISLTIGIFSVAAWAMIGNLFIDKNANNMYLMINPFRLAEIPVLGDIPNGYHVFLLAVMVFIGYFIVYHIARMFTKKV